MTDSYRFVLLSRFLVLVLFGMWSSVWTIIFAALHVAEGDHYFGTESELMHHHAEITTENGLTNHEFGSGESSSGSGFSETDKKIAIEELVSGSGSGVLSSSGSGSGAIIKDAFTEDVQYDEWPALESRDLHVDSVIPISSQKPEIIESIDPNYEASPGSNLPLLSIIPEQVTEGIPQQRKFHSDQNIQKNFSDLNSAEENLESSPLEFSETESHMNVEKRAEYSRTQGHIEKRNDADLEGEAAIHDDETYEEEKDEYQEDEAMEVSEESEDSFVPKFEPADSSIERFTLALNLRKPSSSAPDVRLEAVNYDYMHEEPDLLHSETALHSGNETRDSHDVNKLHEAPRTQQKNSSEEIDVLEEDSEDRNEETEKYSEGLGAITSSVKAEGLSLSDCNSVQDVALLDQRSEVDIQSQVNEEFSTLKEDDSMKKPSEKSKRNLSGNSGELSPTLKFFQDHIPAISLSIAAAVILIVSAYITVTRKKKAEQRKCFQSLVQSKQDNMHFTPYGMPVIREEEAIRLRTRSSGV